MTREELQAEAEKMLPAAIYHVRLLTGLGEDARSMQIAAHAVHEANLSYFKHKDSRDYLERLYFKRFELRARMYVACQGTHTPESYAAVESNYRQKIHHIEAQIHDLTYPININPSRS